MHVAVAGRSDLPCNKILLVLTGRKWLLFMISPSCSTPGGRVDVGAAPMTKLAALFTTAGTLHRAACNAAFGSIFGSCQQVDDFGRHCRIKAAARQAPCQDTKQEAPSAVTLPLPQVKQLPSLAMAAEFKLPAARDTMS